MSSWRMRSAETGAMIGVVTSALGQCGIILIAELVAQSTDTAEPPAGAVRAAVTQLCQEIGSPTMTLK